MEVSEFLRAVRRIVVDFVVGRVLSHNGEASAVSVLDDITTYYLLHRHDFGMDDASVARRCGFHLNSLLIGIHKIWLVSIRQSSAKACDMAARTGRPRWDRTH